MEWRNIFFCCVLSEILTFAPTEYLVTLAIDGDELVPIWIHHTAHTAHAVPPPVWIGSLSQTVTVAGTTDRKNSRRFLQNHIISDPIYMAGSSTVLTWRENESIYLDMMLARSSDKLARIQPKSNVRTRLCVWGGVDVLRVVRVETIYLKNSSWKISNTNFTRICWVTWGSIRK